MAANVQSPILASLGVGSVIGVVAPPDESGSSYLGVAEVPPQGLCVSPGGTLASENWTITMYEYDGANVAKVSLMTTDYPDGEWFWAAATDSQLLNPIVIDREPGQFILTDEDGAGSFSIQNTFAPPDPYLAVATNAGSPPVDYLQYGWAEGVPSPFRIEPQITG